MTSGSIDRLHRDPIARGTKHDFVPRHACPVETDARNIFSGTLVFVGTRVPVRFLFDYLEGSKSLDEFLHQFPSVKRESAIAVLDAAYETVAADANIV